MSKDMGAATKEVSGMFGRTRRLGEDEEVALTPRLEKVVQMARLEATQLGHGYTDTEHLLLGLVRESEGESGGVAARVLADLGVSYEEVRRMVSEARGTDA
jgi:ATP-dependent Clp protease ATP-binding subunit ClpC